MSSIAVYPPGLISLLGLQDQGRTPQQLAEYIQGTADFRDLYCSQFDGSTDTSFAGGLGAGFTPVFTVPSSQVWIVRTYGCLLEGAAGQTGRLYLAERGPNAAGDKICPVSPMIGLAAAGVAISDIATFIPTQWHVMRPGTCLGISVRTALSAGTTATLGLKVTILRF